MGGEGVGKRESDPAYPKKDWVYIDIGTRSDLLAYLDDIGLVTSMDFRWFVERVYIDSTG